MHGKTVTILVNNCVFFINLQGYLNPYIVLNMKTKNWVNSFLLQSEDPSL